MTLEHPIFDPQILQPFSAPAGLHRHAITVGQNIPSDISGMLRTFEKLLAHPSEDAALVVATSGSTGMPKKTVLSSRALTASGRATEQFCGTQHAQWMLALPVHYVAGAQVLARSVLGGTTPVVASSITRGEHFTPQSFLSAAEKMSGGARMLSLVPTQLHTLLEAAETQPAVLEALQSFDGILLGGASASATLLQQAEEKNLKVYTTYGSAETSGGCVYNGKPLPGVSIRIEKTNEGTAGRIWLGGDMVGSGYLNDPHRTQKHFFFDSAGLPWYRTDDVGAFSRGQLRVEGRSDDIIITGGVKVSPAPIVQQLEKHPLVREAFVCGIPDAKWGSAVVAAVNVREKSGSFDGEISALIEQLDPAQRPKHLEALDSFPQLSTGKPDRKKLAALLAVAAGK